MIYAYLIIYGNEQSLSVTLIFAICWLLNVHGGYLGVHPSWRPISDVRANVSPCPSLHIKHFHSGQLLAFSA